MSNLNPGAWLGILKWSLAQSDGTHLATDHRLGQLAWPS